MMFRRFITTPLSRAYFTTLSSKIAKFPVGHLFLGIPEKRKFYGERRSQAIAKGLGYSLSQPKAKLELRRKPPAVIFLFSAYSGKLCPRKCIK